MKNGQYAMLMTKKPPKNVIAKTIEMTKKVAADTLVQHGERHRVWKRGSQWYKLVIELMVDRMVQNDGW